MTKQEQIEEMAKYICNACEMGHGFDGCSYGGREHYKRCSITQKTAKALYNAGYRKIPENAVVLTEEEYIDLSRNYVTEQIEQAHKKTTEEILLLLGRGYDETEKTEFNNLQWYKEFCRELKHRYGVEVEE